MSRRSRMKEAPPAPAKHTLATVRLDSFLNTITGLGDATRNKLTGITQQYDATLDIVFLESLFKSSDLAWNIISSLPAEAMKDGFGLATPAGDEAPEQIAERAQAVMEEAARLCLAEKALEAACWGRGYGLGAIIMGIKGAGKPEEPFDEENPNARLIWLQVADRRTMVAATYYSDPDEDKFGEVETYQVNPSSPSSGVAPYIIHETRVIRFPGELTSQRERQNNQGCDYSVMQRVEQVLEQTTQNWEAVCQLMADMSQGVFSVDGLIDMLATGNETALLTRMRVLDMTRSVGRSIVLDSKSEKFERVRTPMDGVNDAILRTWERLCAAAKTPMFKLFGKSEAGLGDTGQTQLRVWYDQCGREREQMFGPRLLTAIRLISRGLGYDDAWHITWPSLWKMTPAEQADQFFKYAQADQIYLMTKVVTPSEVALARFANGDEFNAGKIQIDAQTRKAQMALDKKAATQTEDPEDDTTKSSTALAPTDIAKIITVNEGRALVGFGPYAGADGNLTISEFTAKHGETIAAAAKAETGTTEGDAVDNTETPPGATPPDMPMPEHAPPPPRNTVDDFATFTHAAKEAREAGLVLDEQQMRDKFPDMPVKKIIEE